MTRLKELVVLYDSLLFDYLRMNLNGSKNNIKSFLSKEMISVNDKIVTKYNYPLKKGDKLTIGAKSINSFIGKVKIIYEDKDIIVVDKPYGMLTVATEEEKDNKNNLYEIILKYLKKRNSNSKLYVVHRLDRDTSGIILFAKSEELKNLFQDNWNDIATRVYYAVVYGVTKESETIKSFLKENDNLVTYSNKEGKLAITLYKRIKNNDMFSLLEINIKTGRRNQIRVHLKEIGHPIVGDEKYGFKNKIYKRMMLHASKLVIKNPKTGKTMTFVSPVDNKFNDMVK